MTKTLVGCLVLLALAGCATAPAPKTQKVRVVDVQEVNDRNAQLNPDKTYVCENEAKTGSNYKTAVCRTVRTRELERQAAQDQLDSMSRSASIRR